MAVSPPELCEEEADQALSMRYARDTIAALRKAAFAPHIWNQFGFAASSICMIAPAMSVGLGIMTTVRLAVDRFGITVFGGDDDEPAIARLCAFHMASYTFNWGCHEHEIAGPISRWRMPPGQIYYAHPGISSTVHVSNPTSRPIRVGAVLMGTYVREDL